MTRPAAEILRKLHKTTVKGVDSYLLDEFCMQSALPEVELVVLGQEVAKVLEQISYNLVLLHILR